MHCVYVLQDRDDDRRFYIGFTSDLRRRLDEHHGNRVLSTRGRRWRLVYYEAYVTRDAARRRERVLKHDGRSRRGLMDRVRQSLTDEPDGK